MLRFRARTSARLVLDLHAPGHAERGVYVFLPRKERPPVQREATARWAEALAVRAPEMPRDDLSRECEYPSRYNTTGACTSWAWDRLEPAAAATIETSYQELWDGPAEVGRYRELGRRVALAAGDLLGG
jgi:hypothetical protein